jgi:hypothetical protein
MAHRPPRRTAQISFSVSPELKATLEIESWESQMSLSNYIRGLLERRGKWARSVGVPGGYDIAKEPTGE